MYKKQQAGKPPFTDAELTARQGETTAGRVAHVKRWCDANLPGRYAGLIDACYSCSLQTGMDLADVAAAFRALGL